MRRNPGHNLPAAALVLFIIATGVAYALMYGTRPYMGDDLNYHVSNGIWIETHSPALLRLPTHIAGCWLNLNGRAADSLNILPLNFMPHPLLAVLCGLAVAGLYVMALAWVRVWRPGTVWAGIAAILLFAALPWWDSNMFLVVQFNYVWTSALMLAALWLVFRRPLRSRWWLPALPLMFFIGQGHEACGLPVAIGLALWCVICRDGLRAMPPMNRVMLYAVMAGGVLTVSPAMLGRASATGIPDDPLWLLLLKSDLLAMVLCVSVVWMAVTRRHTLTALCRTPWTVFATASIASMAISGYSGIIGRSGWFAQVFALVALAGIAGQTFRQSGYGRPSVMATGTILLLMTAQTIGQCVLQLRANREAGRILTLYESSTDGMVMYDITPRSRLPWWHLGRVKGIFPAYDRWCNGSLSRLDPKGRKLLVVPESFATARIHADRSRTDLGDGIFVTSLRPQSPVTYIGGEPYYVRRLPDRYPGLYIYTPLDPEPGDRIVTTDGPVF